MLEARTFQPPVEAEAWLEEMLAHVKCDKRHKTLTELDDLESEGELGMAA